MKLYSPQGQQYYTAVDNNNKKEGKKTTTDNFTIQILQSVVALYQCELEYIVCNIHLHKFNELILQSEQLIFSTIC